MTRVPVTEDHEMKEKLVVDYIVPGHDPRLAATSLFTHTRAKLIEREQGKCWLSRMTAEELGIPLEAHHYPVERCFAERWDWVSFHEDCIDGKWGPHAKAFDWANFFQGSEIIFPDDMGGKAYLKVRDPYLFVDDMTVNGLLLAKKFHTGADTGIHTIPYPIFLAVKYLAEGYKFSDTIIIHHEQETTMQTDPNTPVVPANAPAEDVGNGNPPPPGITM